MHVLVDGRIVRPGGKELALELEEKGYAWLEEEVRDAQTDAGGVGAIPMECASQQDLLSSTDYESFERGLSAQPDHVLDGAPPKQGLERFEEVGFPTRSTEEAWRHTNVGTDLPFGHVPAGGRPSGRRPREAEPFKVPECDDLVFVNGRFDSRTCRPRLICPKAPSPAAWRWR